MFDTFKRNEGSASNFSQKTQEKESRNPETKQDFDPKIEHKTEHIIEQNDIDFEPPQQFSTSQQIKNQLNAIQTSKLQDNQNLQSQQTTQTPQAKLDELKNKQSAKLVSRLKAGLTTGILAIAPALIPTQPADAEALRITTTSGRREFTGQIIKNLNTKDGHRFMVPLHALSFGDLLRLTSVKDAREESQMFVCNAQLGTSPAKTSVIFDGMLSFSVDELSPKKNKSEQIFVITEQITKTAGLPIPPGYPYVPYSKEGKDKVALEIDQAEENLPLMGHKIISKLGIFFTIQDYIKALLIAGPSKWPGESGTTITDLKKVEELDEDYFEQFLDPKNGDGKPDPAFWARINGYIKTNKILEVVSASLLQINYDPKTGSIAYLVLADLRTGKMITYHFDIKQNILRTGTKGNNTTIDPNNITIGDLEFKGMPSTCNLLDKAIEEKEKPKLERNLPKKPVKAEPKTK